MVHNAIRIVRWKDYKGVTAELKTVYQASIGEAAIAALRAFAQKCVHKYRTIAKFWQK